MRQILTFILALFTVVAFQSCDKANATEASILPTSKKEEVKESIVNAYQIGDQVDDFSLKGVDGNMLSMASYPDAEGFIIVFTCNTCPYSKKYEERIQALHDKHAANGWPVIAINPNDPEVQPGDSFEAMVEYAAEKNFTFPYVFDEGQKVYPKWGAARTPHTFLVQKTDDGNVLQYIGAIDDNTQKPEKVTVNYIDNAVAAMKAGETVDPNFTKAIGCTIKTK